MNDFLFLTLGILATLGLAIIVTHYLKKRGWFSNKKFIFVGNEKHILFSVLFLMIVAVIGSIFVPIPYYQSYDAFCKMGFDCPEKGWHLGLSLWQRYTYTTAGIPTERSHITISSPTPTVYDQTSGWQTYRNEEFGFEVKYPAYLSEIKSYGFSDSDTMFTSGGKSSKPETEVQRLTISIVTDKISLEEYLEELDSIYIAYDEFDTKSFDPEEVLKESTVKVGLYQVFQRETAHFNLPNTAPSSYGIDTFFDLTPRMIVHISLMWRDEKVTNSFRQLNNQILSTFRFAEKSEAKVGAQAENPVGQIDNKNDCEAVGGVWTHSFVNPSDLNAWYCNIRTSDAGKACTDSSQCESACVLDRGVHYYGKSEVVGRCYEWRDSRDSCLNLVANGKIEYVPCP